MGAKILLVEAHDFLRKTLRWWLTREFPVYQIIEATTAEEALSLAKINSLRLIIVDDELLTMDGLEITLRNTKNGLRPQVVVLAFREAGNGQLSPSTNGANAYISHKNLHTELDSTLTKLLSSQ